MARNLFSIPIFFIVFRECLEASIIVSVLLGLVEQIVSGNDIVSPNRDHDGSIPALTSHPGPDHEASPIEEEKTPEGSTSNGNTDQNVNPTEASTPPDSTSEATPEGQENDPTVNKRLVRKLRLQIFLGAAIGFVIAIAIGAAFIAVWFTQASNLWQKSENLWEGIFSLVA